MLVVAIAGLIGWELVRDRLKNNPAQVAPRGSRASASHAVERALPLTLVVTFVLVPSTATRIFKSFLCDAIDYDDANTTRRYLHDDLVLSCDSEDYDAMERSAGLLIFVWPLGVPVLYSALLWATRDALRARVPTALTRATAFLWADYESTAYWWEPIEMCRKLTLTGWVLLIKEEFEQARVIVALTVSTAFLALHLSFKPLRRAEDGALMACIELALVLAYTCVLLIKVCETSTEACRTFGFGDTAN
eukprot:1809271-Prymnesium_polylepis.1